MPTITKPGLYLCSDSSLAIILQTNAPDPCYPVVGYILLTADNANHPPEIVGILPESWSSSGNQFHECDELSNARITNLIELLEPIPQPQPAYSLLTDIAERFLEFEHKKKPTPKKPTPNQRFLLKTNSKGTTFILDRNTNQVAPFCNFKLAERYIEKLQSTEWPTETFSWMDRNLYDEQMEPITSTP